MAQAPSPFADCTRFLSGHGPRDPAAKLREAEAALRPGEGADIYGSGPLIASFEAEIADLLGKQAAIFMPSGTMAQQIALRLWCDQAACPRIGMHATSHLHLHEEGAVSKLHGLEVQLAADATRLMHLDDLQSLERPLAALLWELPQREIGGQLPTWSALEKELQWARADGIRCHLDGARLWEAAPFYQRSHAAICAPFDSVYVSFYKGLGGIAGAALAGDREFVEASRPWLRRHGGNLISMYPFILSARAGLHLHLERFPEYCQRAKGLATALSGITGLEPVPAAPPTPMMHLHIQREADALNRANEALARKHGVVLFGRANPIAPGVSKVELSIGAASQSMTDDEVVALFDELLQAAR